MLHLLGYLDGEKSGRTAARPASNSVRMKCDAMSRTLREEILKGFDPKFDCLNFRPQLQTILNAGRDGLSSELDVVGTSLLTRVAMAAIEQNTKLLAAGTVEKMRYLALRLYGESLVENSFWAGEAAAMNTLADGYPQIIPKINEHHVNRSVRRFEFRKTIARGVLELLDEIEARKQKVGKPGRSAHRSLVNKTDAQQLRELADGEILNACANRLPVIDRNNKEAIKRLIPKVVRLYFHNGHLNQLGGTDQDTIDSHSKRIARMLDEIIPK